MNQELGLSTIDELTDLDISFLINQLSTTSGEITERTIEELLRDAERLVTPTSSQNKSTPGQPHSNSEKSEKSPEAFSNVSSTNVFMTAIASLSEVTNRIQSKMAEEEMKLENKAFNTEGPLSIAKTKPLPFREKSAVTKTTVDNSRRVVPSKLEQDTKKACGVAGEKINQVKSRTESVRSTAAEKVYSRPWRTAPKVKLSAGLTTKCTTRSVSGASSVSSRSGTIRKRMVIGGVVDDSSARNDCRPPGKQSSTIISNKTVSSRFRQDESSDSCSQSGGLLRKLKEDNARLNLQIRQLQDQLKCTALAPKPTRHIVPKSNNANARNGSKMGNPTLAPKIDQFQHQLSVIQAKYEAQIQSLTEKCTELERDRQLVIPHSEVQKTIVNIPTCDRGCQTDKEKRDAVCQSYRPEDLNEVHCIPQPTIREVLCRTEEQNVDQCVSQPHAREVLTNRQFNIQDGGLSAAKNLPDINFEFHNLDLDGQFVPWQENCNENVPEKLNKAPGESNNKKIVKEFKKVGKSGDLHLLTTIRGLQVEIQTKNRDIRRLKNEIDKAKLKPAERMKGIIRRTMGTQTIGLGACTSMPYDPNLFQDSAVLSRENERLRANMKTLESEIGELNERRVQDLKMLQEKHEEEISALLEQKLFLANKLDALLARTFR